MQEKDEILFEQAESREPTGQELLMERREVKIWLSVRKDLWEKAEALAREGGWLDAGKLLESMLNIGSDGLIEQLLDQMEDAYAYYRAHTMGQEVVANGSCEGNRDGMRASPHL